MIRTEMAAALTGEMRPLRRFAMMLTRSAEDADDLCQDTIERALLKAHLFDGRNLRGWLFTVCRRLFLNQIRRRRVHAATEPLDDAPPSALAVRPEQESALGCRALSELYAGLCPSDRAVLSMIALDGARYEDAARALGLPVGTVRSRLSRARGRLKRALEEGRVIQKGSAAA